MFGREPLISVWHFFKTGWDESSRVCRDPRDTLGVNYQSNNTAFKKRSTMFPSDDVCKCGCQRRVHTLGNGVGGCVNCKTCRKFRMSERTKQEIPFAQEEDT